MFPFFVCERKVGTLAIFQKGFDLDFDAGGASPESCGSRS